MTREFHAVPRSAVPHREGTRRVSDLAEGDLLEVSVYLKPYPREPEEGPAGPLRRETREQMRARRTVEHEQDIAAVTAFAAEHGLRVVSAEPERRLVRLAGSAGQFGAAFVVSLGMYDADGRQFRSYSGTLSVPADLTATIESVLGLDNRPVARPYAHRRAASGDTGVFLPNEMAGLYHFPRNLTGTQHCTGLIELGGGYYQSDIDAAFSAMGVHAPTVVAVDVDGGKNDPGHDDADGEVALDIQVAGGVAPGARLAVYFAPDSGQGFIDAVTQAAHDKFNTPTAISISWGSPEKEWGLSEMDSMTSALSDAATLGISVFAAAGDRLASDGLHDGWAHVDFPASSPWAIGCGGTQIETSGSRITREVVWSNQFEIGTGGGISDHYPVPAFQGGTKLPPSVNDQGHRRGVPDVAGPASDVYRVIQDGQKWDDGGTSAVAPLWAGLTGRLNELAGLSKPVGFFLPVLYGYPAAVRDITEGSNAPIMFPSFGYKAGPGWDACTGLGVPEGGQLAILLACKATRLTPLAAVAWADGPRHMRVFCHTTLGELSEFRCDDSWQPGATLTGPAPASKLSAVEWNDAEGVHLRVYYQDPQNVIREQCYDGAWLTGQLAVRDASPGTGLAAVQWSDAGGGHIRLYYQDTRNAIREYCYDNGRWQAGATPTLAAAGTGLAALRWTDAGGTHIRVYYAENQNALREQCFDGTSWQQGQFAVADAAPGTSLAAVVWSDSVGLHQRVYYQDVDRSVREQFADDGGWARDTVAQRAAAGSGLGALYWSDSGGAHVRVFYHDRDQLIREQWTDGGRWQPGPFVLPPA